MQRTFSDLTFLKLGETDTNKLDRAAALSFFFRKLFWLKAPVTTEAQSKMIELSPVGAKRLHEVMETSFVTSEESDPSEIEGIDASIDETSSMTDPAFQFSMAMLVKLFDPEGLLIDLEQTDFGQLEEFLNANLKNGFLWAPYLFDRLLYNKAFEELPPVPTRLDSEAALKLSEGLPIGIFQFGNYLTGPLGLLKSLAIREYSCPTEIPIFHCASPTCNRLHGVRIDEEDFWLQFPRMNIGQIQPNTPVDYESTAWVAYKDHLEGDDFDDYYPIDIVGFLGDAFDRSEIKLVLNRLLLRGVYRDPQLQTVLSLNLKQKKINDLSNLDKATCLQLILLQNDAEIIAAIDECIFAEEIVIPASEIREIVAAPEPSSWQSNKSQCSALGFRVQTFHSASTPLARLKRLILNLYSAPKEQESLDWLLRKVPGKSLGQKVETLIRRGALKTAIKELIFTSLEKLENAMDEVCASHFYRPTTESDEDLFLDRFLWKLGFSITRSEPVSSRLAARSRELRNGSMLELGSDAWKEQVRSVGVNTFVSAEEFLDQTLSFCTWLLLEEHVSESHKFELIHARSSVARYLSGRVTTDEGPVLLRGDGRNTLFPLITGFDALVGIIEELTNSTEFSTHARPKELIPDFVQRSRLQNYPYLHKHFLLDMERVDIASCKQDLSEIARLLIKGGVMQVRNGLDHKSDSFPSKEELRICCDAIDEVISLCESKGYIPVIYTTRLITRDQFGISRITSEDFNGRTVDWYQSPSLHCCNHARPSAQAPQILVPAITMPGTGEIFRCGLKEKSLFTEMWTNYPKRKYISRAKLLSGIEVSGGPHTPQPEATIH